MRSRANEPHFARRRKALARNAERERRPREGEHRVSHRYVDVAALPALIANPQGKQNVDDRRKASAGDVGGKHRRDHGIVAWPRLQIQ